MGLALITPPTADPVSVFDLRTQLRIDGADEDAYLLTCLQRAQAHLVDGVGWTGVACLTTTWEYTFDTFPCGRTLREMSIRLPLRPVQSVTSVKYVDGDGVEQTLVAGTDYVAHLTESPALIALAAGKLWPTPRTEVGAVRVRFVAGWTGPAAVSQNIRLAIILLASHYYTHRDDNAAPPADVLNALLANEKVYL